MEKISYSLQLKRTTIAIVAIASSLIFNFNAVAQLKPANAIYYFNEFLVNPSMAGKEQTLKASLGYRQQLSPFEGSPQTQYLVLDYGLGAKSGLGLKIYNDKAGLLRKTSISASYAYHLPLNEEDRLSFGISTTFTNDQLDEGALKGDPDDPDVADVNQRKSYFDSDFGMTYRNNSLSVQATFPNMLATLNGTRSTEADYALFFSSISYRVETNMGILEPKIVFRGVKGFKNVVDIGTNLLFKSTTENKLNLIALYHSSKNATLGFELIFNEHYNINGSYTIGTAQLRGYSAGDFEIGIGFRL